MDILENRNLATGSIGNAIRTWNVTLGINLLNLNIPSVTAFKTLMPGGNLAASTTLNSIRILNLKNSYRKSNYNKHYNRNFNFKQFCFCYCYYGFG
jgi:hypothetical protein